MAHLGLRTASPLPADALALTATRGRATAAELAGLAEDDLGRVVTGRDAAAALALLWAGRDREDLLQAGARLYSWLGGTGRLPARPLHHQGAAQALYLAGRAPRLLELWPSLDRLPTVVRHDLEVDLAHPGLGLGPEAGRHERWTALLAARWLEHGLSAPVVTGSGPAGHLFDRLRSSSPAATAHGPLVTVVVPCWQPDEGLLTSVASLTAQTYADLEIVLVDDASGEGYEDLFDAAVAADPRVRRLTMERNGGSYLARRAAVEASTGELVTTQDADDWSHPERLERQVAALTEHPDAPASRSLAVRARDDLTHQWFGYRAVRDNASSLLVRRRVLGAAGTFLPIRKSADSEYAERLTRLVGPVVDTGTPLAITRLRGGSLSRGDFTYQWSHPDRIAFRGTYRAWHRRLLEQTEAPTDADLPEVPPAFARGIPGTPTAPARLDLCLVGDWSLPPTDARHAALVRALDAYVQPGGPARQVGLWHLERPRADALTRPEMHPAWFDLVLSRPELHVLTRTRECRVGTVLVTDATSLLLAVAQPTAVLADRVEVALDAATVTPGELGLPADLLGVADACATWWGSRPAWVGAPGAPEAPGDVATALPGLVLVPGVLDGAAP